MSQTTVTHLQSATQIIEIGGVRILTDPWLTQGEYYGSWFHFPPFPEAEIGGLNYDYIYVSHIHPDHLSERTFALLKKSTPVLIHEFSSPFLKRKIEGFGFSPVELRHAEPFALSDTAELTIYSADNCDPELCGKFFGCAPQEVKFATTSIDTLALFSDGEHRILNLNDCPFGLARETVRQNGLDKEIDLLLVGYAGAGPFPQCFEFDDPADQRAAAEKKQAQFLDYAIRFVDQIRPKAFMPFAGTYVLGGARAHLNELRGVPGLLHAAKTIEAGISVDSDPVILNQGESYDVETGSRSQPYRDVDCKAFAAFMAEISKAEYAFSHAQLSDDEVFRERVAKATERFQAKAKEIGFRTDTTIAIEAPEFGRLCLSTNSETRFETTDAPVEEPFVRISLDGRLLSELVRGPRYAHWNNAEIGSHLTFERRPNTFERGLYHCLCFFHA